MSHSLEWFTVILQSRSLLERVVADIRNLNAQLLCSATQLSGYEALRTLQLRRDDFLICFFEHLNTSGLGNEGPQGDFVDSIRLNILADFEENLSAAQEAEETLRVSMLSLLERACLGSRTACVELCSTEPLFRQLRKALLGSHGSLNEQALWLQVLENVVEIVDAEMLDACLVDYDLATVLFELLRVERMSENSTISVLRILSTLFTTCGGEALQRSLIIGLDNLLAVGQRYGMEGGNQVLHTWFLALQSISPILMPSDTSCSVPASVLRSCGIGLEVKYSAEVLKMCWETLTILTKNGYAREVHKDLVLRSFELVRNCEKVVVRHPTCLAALIQFLLAFARKLELKSDHLGGLLDDVDTVLVPCLMGDRDQISIEVVDSLFEMLSFSMRCPRQDLRQHAVSAMNCGLFDLALDAIVVNASKQEDIDSHALCFTDNILQILGYCDDQNSIKVLSNSNGLLDLMQTMCSDESPSAFRKMALTATSAIVCCLIEHQPGVIEEGGWTHDLERWLEIAMPLASHLEEGSKSGSTAKNLLRIMMILDHRLDWLDISIQDVTRLFQLISAEELKQDSRFILASIPWVFTKFGQHLSHSKGEHLSQDLFELWLSLRSESDFVSEYEIQMIQSMQVRHELASFAATLVAMMDPSKSSSSVNGLLEIVSFWVASHNGFRLELMQHDVLEQLFTVFVHSTDSCKQKSLILRLAGDLLWQPNPRGHQIGRSAAIKFSSQVQMEMAKQMKNNSFQLLRESLDLLAACVGHLDYRQTLQNLEAGVPFLEVCTDSQKDNSYSASVCSFLTLSLMSLLNAVAEPRILTEAEAICKPAIKLLQSVSATLCQEDESHLFLIGASAWSWILELFKRVPGTHTRYSANVDIWLVIFRLQNILLDADLPNYVKLHSVRVLHSFFMSSANPSQCGSSSWNKHLARYAITQLRISQGDSFDTGSASTDAWLLFLIVLLRMRVSWSYKEILQETNIQEWLELTNKSRQRQCNVLLLLLWREVMCLVDLPHATREGLKQTLTNWYQGAVHEDFSPRKTRENDSNANQVIKAVFRRMEHTLCPLDSCDTVDEIKATMQALSGNE